MRLTPRRWFAFRGEFADDVFGDGVGSAFVLLEDLVERRFEVDQFDAGVVVGEEVDPALAGLLKEVGGIEGIIPFRPQMLPALLAGDLDDFPLILGGSDVQFGADIIERYDGKLWTVLLQPGVFSAPRQA